MVGRTTRVIRSTPKRFVSKIVANQVLGQQLNGAKVRDAGVVYKDVDAAFGLEYMPDGLSYGVVLRHVELCHGHARALLQPRPSVIAATPTRVRIVA